MVSLVKTPLLLEAQERIAQLPRGGIATLAKNHGYTITSEEVYAHADFLGQDGDLTDFELEMISGGGYGRSSC